MANLVKISSPAAIRKAMAEYDRIGQDAFLQKYGFGRALRFRLKEGDRRYDSKAILGAAYGIQYPAEGPLSGVEYVPVAPQPGCTNFQNHPCTQ